MLLERCTLCFDSTSDVKSILVKNASGITFSSMLQFIAPEVEWLADYTICGTCIEHLTAAYKFKEQCLDVKNHEFSEDCSNLYDTVKLEYDSDETSRDKEPVIEESEFFICYHCETPYQSKDELIKHLESEHVNKPEEDTSKYKRKEKCLQCGRTFVKTGSLLEHSGTCDGVNRHMKIEGKREYQCIKCKRFYTTDKILRAHEKRCAKKDFDKTDHQCTKCNAFFKHLSTLRKHLKHGCKKEKNYPIFCKLCDEAFKSQQDIKEHMRVDHERSLLHCDVCDENFDTSKDYEFHKKAKHKKESSSKRIFTCEICNEQFNFVKDTIDHYIRIHSVEEKTVKPYCCDVCNKRFRSSTNLINHKLYHERNRTNICSICGKSFITKNDLLSHELIHYTDRNYKCDKCEKSFKTSSNLRTHCLIVHSDPQSWKFICHVCGKRFPLKSNHDQHLRRHTGEKNFLCTLCKKAFASKSELQEHVRYHSNVRCYQCDQCGREYRKKNTLDVHLTKAHGIGNAKIPVRERKHACHICPGRFHDRLKLARHLCTHSGLKPFSCNICERKFTDRSYLRQHLKNSHNIQEQLTDLRIIS